ncbi:MAG: alanine racemase [Variibacter sp.]
MVSSSSGANVPPGEAGGILTIDLGAIVANWRDLAGRAASAECGAVIKADAYGCGIEPVARALAAAGCRTFFVAHLVEARRARAAAPDAAIYVLNGLLPESAPAYAECNLQPVLGGPDEIAEWQAFKAGGWPGGAALHVDTGMNRLGLRPREAVALARRNDLKDLGLNLLMSHFACADEPAHPLNAKQMGDFKEIAALYPDLRASLANSSGIFLDPDAHFDLLRPGVALYGGNPTPGHANPMRPVVKLESRVIQVRSVSPQETVGYGATWTARQAARIAVVSTGYADGLLRAAGGSDVRGGAEAIVAGHRCPIAGRVSMDLIAVDVTAVPDGAVKRGSLAAFLDETITVDDLAAHAGTIGYEILTSLGRRYHRIYKHGAESAS